MKINLDWLVFLPAILMSLIGIIIVIGLLFSGH